MKRLIKQRDPAWKMLTALKKSNASGSHGDKKKEIPRKNKHKKGVEDD